MIPRYARQVMTTLWSDSNRFKTWFIVEAHVCETQGALGQIPMSTATNIQEWRKRVEAGENCWDTTRIQEIEAEIKHDVIAFLTSIGEAIGKDSEFLHYGMTSSDLLDTALALILRDAIDIILDDVEHLLASLKAKALQYKYQPIMGRSHGMFAEPTTVGVKFAGFYSEFLRHKKRLVQLRQEISTCSLSGAVGIYGGIDPEVEATVADLLDLQIEPVATQVIPRDRHATMLTVLGLIAGGIERLATEIRLLQRSEVAEMQEAFSNQQKGSSAMPHKRNPILSENLTGLARLIRSAVTPALENIALWHERDISHSAVERIIFPQATTLADFALHRLCNVVDNLQVHITTIDKNIEKSLGLFASGALLIAFVEHGVEKNSAYRQIQRLSIKAWDEKIHLRIVLQQFLQQQTADHPLYQQNFDKFFDINHHIRHVDLIFQRLFSVPA